MSFDSDGLGRVVGVGVTAEIGLGLLTWLIGGKHVNCRDD